MESWRLPHSVHVDQASNQLSTLYAMAFSNDEEDRGNIFSACISCLQCHNCTKILISIILKFP
jgi:hypothetical protein